MANCFSRNAKISETFICRLATWVVRLFSCFSLQTIIAGAIPPKRGCFVSACRTAMTPFFVLREEKSLAKVYEKKLIFCFISICQAENRPRRRMQQSGTVTETKDARHATRAAKLTETDLPSLFSRNILAILNSNEQR